MSKKKIACLVICLLFLAGFMYVIKGQYTYTARIDTNEGGENVGRIDASLGVLEQDFTLSENVRYIDILVANAVGESVTLNAELVNQDAHEVLDSAVIDILPSGNEEEVVRLNLVTEEITDATNLAIRLSADTDSETLFYCVQNGQYENSASMNSSDLSARLRMSVVYGETVIQWAFFFVTLLLGATVIFVVFMPDKCKKLEFMFVIVAATAGIAFALITPPFQECDGWEHFLRVVDVSYGNWLGSFGNFTHEGGVIVVPENLADLNYTLINPDSGYAEAFINNLKSISFSKQTTLLPFNGSVTSFYYWPQAIGLLLGRVMGLSVYWCVFLSRFFNLLIYIGITYVAIKMMPVCRNLFAVIALYPLTIFQAASDSPDALLSALCFLFIALCFHYAYDNQKQCTWKDALCLGGILAVIFICKYVYICIGLLVFLIPWKKFSTKKNYWISFAIALIPVIMIVAFLMCRTLVPSGIVTTAPAEAGQMTQTQYILQNPIYFVKVLLQTVITNFAYYVNSISILGSLNYAMPILFVVLPAYTALVAGLDMNQLSAKIKVKGRILCGLAFLFTGIGLFTALYVGDTRINPVGGSIVAGVQGRYFIPVLTLAFIPFISNNVDNKIKNFDVKVIAASGLILFYSVIAFVRMCY